MHNNMEHYKKKDIKSDFRKGFIDGYEAAIKDLQNARDFYLDNNEEPINAFRELQEQITEDFSDYAVQFLQEQRDQELVAILENQDLLDNEASEKG